MASDLRCRHDESLRLQAARLHDAGLGRRAIGARLGVPHETVRRWLEKYGAGGTELLLKMDGKQARYDYETKVAAARAVVDGGHVEARGDGALRDCERIAAQELVPPVPRGRCRGAPAQAEGQAQGLRP